MPTKLGDSIQDQLVFPDDVTAGTVFELINESVFSPEEVRNYIEEDYPEWGWWLHVKTGQHGETWLSAPEELRQELVDDGAKEGDCYQVTHFEKPDGDDSEPYEVVLEPVEEGDPL